MILSNFELHALPAIFDIAETADITVEVSYKMAGGRRVTVTVSPQFIMIRADFDDSPPIAEFYKHKQGFLQAYGHPKNFVKKS